MVLVCNSSVDRAYTQQLSAGVASSATRSPASPRRTVRYGLAGERHVIRHAHPELTS